MTSFEVLGYVGLLAIIALAMLFLAPILSFVLNIFSKFPRFLILMIVSSLFFLSWRANLKPEVSESWLNLGFYTLLLATLLGLGWDIARIADKKEIMKDLRIKLPLHKEKATP